MDTAPHHSARSLRLSQQDNIVVAGEKIEKGAGSAGVTALQRIPFGHKMATVDIARDEPIVKFGQIIGFAKQPIAKGDWVHEHNVYMHDFERDYRFAEAARPENILPVSEQATFEGYRRANGKAGTRNYIGVLTSVNCSTTVAGFIAREIERSGILDDYPNIDGIVALKQANACVIDYRGVIFDTLKKTTPWASAGRRCRTSSWRASRGRARTVP